MKKLELGYGAGAIAEYPWHRDGTRPWMNEDSTRARECIKLLPSLGIKFADTAFRYGNGTSEIILGSELGQESEVRVITKVNMRHLISDAQTSFLRLGFSLSGILLHDPDFGLPWEVHAACEELKRLCYPYSGISTEPSEDARRFFEDHKLNTIEFPFSPSDLRAEQVLKPWLIDRPDILRIANRVLGGPGPKDPVTVRLGLEFVWRNRDWIDVALIGTTNPEHLRECADIVKELNERIEK